MTQENTALSVQSGDTAATGRVGRMLAALSRVNQTILQTRQDRTDLLQNVCHIIHNELAYELVWIGEIEPPQGTAPEATIRYRGKVGDKQIGREADPLIERLVREATACGAPRIVKDVAIGVSAGDAGGWTIAAFPATVTSRQSLALVIATHDEQGIGELEESLLQEFAGDVAFALDTIDIEARSRRAEEELRVSEDRFRRLAEHSMVGIVLIQNDLYRYVNPAFAAIFGYDHPRDIIDRLGPLDLTAPDSRELVAEKLEKRILGQVRASRYQYRGLRKDGQVIDVEEHGARTVHAQRLAVVATVLDITAREASRRRLEALSTAGLALASAQSPQQALNVAVEQIPRILPCDVATVVLFGGAAPRLMACTHHEACPNTVVDIIDGLRNTGETLDLEWPATQETMVTTTEALACTLGAPTPAVVHALVAVPLIVRGARIGLLSAEAARPDQFTADDGRHLRFFADHVAATLQHLRLISSLEDERNRLKTLNTLSHTLSETLNLQEVTLRALEQVGAAFQADGGLLLLWNSTTETLSTLAAERLPEAAVDAELIRHRDAIREKLAEVLDGRPPVVTPLTSPWDWIRNLLPSAATALEIPLRAHGEIIGLMLLLAENAATFDHVDLDLATTLSVPVALALQNARFYERTAGQARAMTEALHRQEELDRMKDELIQNISHELRTPLALVMGYAEMLATGQLGPVDEQQAVAIDVIARRSRMLRGLVEDIALLWHLEQKYEERERLDLTEIVETSVADFRSDAGNKGLCITGATPSLPVPIRGVPLQIRRVLDNLIGNALKFTPQGGALDVVLTAHDRWATLTVTDSGIGVPAEQLSRIFERFYQVNGSARRAHGGTGLGLALVKAIIEAHAGTVEAASPVTADPEHPGTRVTVRLPLTA